jgi:hypothetical protein
LKKIYKNTKTALEILLSYCYTEYNFTTNDIEEEK